jgi:multidrug efflux pump subunit AcrB
VIGFITLSGIATRNAVMLVSHVRNLMEVEGVATFREAASCSTPKRGTRKTLPVLMLRF